MGWDESILKLFLSILGDYSYVLNMLKYLQFLYTGTTKIASVYNLELGVSALAAWAALELC